MTSTRTNQEVLKIILTKLNRLETRFNEIESHLRTIESSVVSDTGSCAVAGPLGSWPLASCSCASLVPQPLLPFRQSFHWESSKRHPSATAYRASVDRLRREFSLDDTSEPTPIIHEEGTVYAHDNDYQSKAVADYLIPDESQRAISPYGGVCPREVIAILDVPHIPSIRYEDAARAATPMTSPGLSKWSESSDSSASSRSSSPTKLGSSPDTPDSHSAPRKSFSYPATCWTKRDLIREEPFDRLVPCDTETTTSSQPRRTQLFRTITRCLCSSKELGDNGKNYGEGKPSAALSKGIEERKDPHRLTPEDDTCHDAEKRRPTTRIPRIRIHPEKRQPATRIPRLLT